MKQIHQKISQFMDDELHHEELESFLLNVKMNPELINKITRYQVMSQALKMDDFVVVNNGFLEKITQKIKQEAHYLLPKQKPNKSIFSIRRKISLAVAASISIIAISVFQLQTMQETDFQNTLPQQLAQQKQMSLQLTSQQLNQQLNKAQTIQVSKTTMVSQHERLKAYLQAHSDDLYTHGSLTAHPMVRVVGYNQD